VHAHRWADLDRTALSGLLPEAVTVLPVGAVEQHGPHLPTSTDIRIATAVAERAADQAAEHHGVPVVLAPGVCFGASQHHLGFGGTISLRPETLLAVLGDVLGSLATSGARRVLIVNGHGGNVGICHAAAASAACAHAPMVVAHVDYWSLLPASTPGVPGHAGRFETALMLAITDGSAAVTLSPRPPVPSAAELPGVQIHSQRRWREIDGYTDDPSAATVQEGRALLDRISGTLTERLVGFAKEPT
jgi:creatinine amidohydrolase